MIKVHVVDNNVPILLNETDFVFIPTEDNGTAIVDVYVKDIGNYFEDNEEDVIYLRESLEEIEELIRENK